MYICLVDRCWLWIFISSISINTPSQSDQIRPTVGRRWKLFQVLVLISISVHDQRDTDLISNTATGDIIRWRDRTWLQFNAIFSKKCLLSPQSGALSSGMLNGPYTGLPIYAIKTLYKTKCHPMGAFYMPWIVSLLQEREASATSSESLKRSRAHWRGPLC